MNPLHAIHTGNNRPSIVIRDRATKAVVLTVPADALGEAELALQVVRLEETFPANRYEVDPAQVIYARDALAAA